MPNVGGRGRRAVDSYPALTKMLDGYFHQDMLVECGGPAAAARTYARDATAAERAAAARELARFIQATSGLPLAEVRRLLGGLGGAWRPPSEAALREVLARLQDDASASGLQRRPQ